MKRMEQREEGAGFKDRAIQSWSQSQSRGWRDTISRTKPKRVSKKCLLETFSLTNTFQPKWSHCPNSNWLICRGSCLTLDSSSSKEERGERRRRRPSLTPGSLGCWATSSHMASSLPQQAAHPPVGGGSNFQTSLKATQVSRTHNSRYRVQTELLKSQAWLGFKCWTVFQVWNFRTQSACSTLWRRIFQGRFCRMRPRWLENVLCIRMWLRSQQERKFQKGPRGESRNSANSLFPTNWRL